MFKKVIVETTIAVAYPGFIHALHVWGVTQVCCYRNEWVALRWNIGHRLSDRMTQKNQKIVNLGLIEVDKDVKHYCICVTKEKWLIKILYKKSHF